MKQWTDEELVNALRQRLETDRRAFNDLAVVTRKLEEVNRRLQESEALKSHFLSNIRNEITNPLTSIVGLAGTLASGRSTERAAEFAEMIYAEADGLDAQLQNIFMAAELESGATVPEWAQVDVAGVLGSLCDRIDYRCREKRITILRQLEGDLQFISDQQKLALIVGNLLANAVEFSPPGATVNLLAEVDGEDLRILVIDAGPGLDTAHQERVFDRFCQLDRGTTKGHRGHGLGLSIARSLAQLLGGSLTLESARGEGCLLTLTLPAPAVGNMPAERGTAGNLFLFDEPETF
jgi:signal transduction histidine kinase